MLEASTLENLAYAEAAAGDYPRAIEHADASFGLRLRSGAQPWSSMTLGGAAIWHVRVGNLPAARDAVRRLLADDDAILRGTDWPSYCYWAAAQIFRLDGHPNQAARALDRARRLMLSSAGLLEPEDRASFMALPWHVDLVQAVSGDQWPDPPR